MNNAKLAVGISTTAAIAAALAWSAANKQVEASEYGEAAAVPEELMTLVAVVAQKLENIDENTKLLGEGETNLVVQGWPTNAKGIVAIRFPVPTNGDRLPDIAVPSGMVILMKAYPLNPGWVSIGSSQSESTNINQSWPLLPNEMVWYQIENANQLYASANAAGCFLCLTVEKKGAR